MVRKELDHRVRHYGLRPPPATDNFRTTTGAALGLPSMGGRAPDPTDARHGPRAAERGRDLSAAARIRSVLVPVDGSPFGEHALPLAAGIARRAGAELRVVHVHTPPGPDEPPVRHYYPDGPYGPSRTRVAYLDEVTSRLASATAVTATPHVYDGWDVLATLQSAAADADLVVMATHGRGLWGRFWHGSVTHDLLRRVRCPVLLVRGGEAPPALGVEPAVRRVLVPFDGTAAVEHVLGPAADLAALLGAEVTLLGTLPFRYYGGPALAAYRAGALPRPMDPCLPWVVYEAFERCAERLAARGIGVETRVVFDDRTAAAAILEFARRRPADLIALTEQRGGLMRFLFGSTADRVVRGASVPVLVTGPNES